MSGLREAHAHIAPHGRALSMILLAQCAGAGDCLEILREAAARRRESPGPDWLLAIGARVEGWKQPGDGPGGWPSLRELDEATGELPCAAMSFDHHMVFANSAALRAGGIDRGTPDPVGGVIGRDEAGVPNGLLLESAAWNTWKLSPEPSAQDRRRHVIDALQDLGSQGFVEVHDMLSQSWLGPLLAELHDDGKLPLSVWLYAPIDEIAGQHEASRSWSRKGDPSRAGTGEVRLAGAKIFIDGTLNSRTAWMLEPYREPLPGMPTGKVITPPDQIESALRTCKGLGIGLAAHAIGDGAVRAGLDAYERLGPYSVASSLAQPIPSFRIEHAEIIDRADTGRFAQLGVLASVQPCHLLCDVEALRRYLPHRLDRVLPLRELIDSGCTPGKLLWFGSDTPIVRPDHQDSVQAAIHRRRGDMTQAESIAWNQRIEEGEAMACFRPVATN